MNVRVKYLKIEDKNCGKSLIQDKWLMCVGVYVCGEEGRKEDELSEEQAREMLGQIFKVL